MRYFNIYILSLCFLLYSCSKENKDSCVDNSSEFDINFSLNLNNTPFQLGDTISYDQYDVLLSEFTFFISDIYLHSKTDSILIDTILLIRYEEFENTISMTKNRYIK